MAGHLPPELIIEIARHLDLCQNVLFFSPSRRRVNVTTLEVLAQVCRNWRNALIGCSRLWTTFRLYPYTGKLRSYPFHVQRWLQCAGPLGLDITISDFYVRALPYQLLYIPDQHYILDTIKPFYKTWRLLELSLPLEQYRPLFSMYAPELRMLEELRISFSAEGWFNGLAVYAFINAPLLTCVELCSRICIFLPLLDYICFPYHQLTTLVCENVFSSDPIFINHILRAANKLQHARLELVTNDNFDDAAYAYYLSFRPFATCPNLLKLEITSQGLCDASFVLAGLTAPALKELRLKHYGEIAPAGDFDLILEAFQKRSQAPLRIVHFRHLHNLDENGPGLVPFLELVGETLKELIIESCTDLNVMDILLAMIFPHYEGRFTGKPDEPYKALLPNLKRFGIAADFFHPVFAGELAKVVHSRGYDIDDHEVRRPRAPFEGLAGGTSFGRVQSSFH